MSDKYQTMCALKMWAPYCRNHITKNSITKSQKAKVRKDSKENPGLEALFSPPSTYILGAPNYLQVRTSAGPHGYEGMLHIYSVVEKQLRQRRSTVHHQRRGKGKAQT